MHRVAARINARNGHPAHRGRQQRRKPDQDDGARNAICAILHSHQEKIVEIAANGQEPVIQHDERGEQRHEKQQRNRQGRHGKKHGFKRCAQVREMRTRRQVTAVVHTHLGRGTSHPFFAIGNVLAIGQRRKALQLGCHTDGGVAFQHRIGRDTGLCANIDAPQNQLTALDTRIFEIHARAQAGAIAYANERGHAHPHRSRLHIAAHLDSRSTQVQIEQHAPVEHVHWRGINQTIRKPPTEVHEAPQRITARLHPPQQQTAPGNR